MSIAKHWADIEETVGQTECSWDHCLVDLRDRLETVESHLRQTRIDVIKLANACAHLVPDRSKFFADLTPDEHDIDPDQIVTDFMEMISAALLEAGFDQASDWLRLQAKQ